MVSTSDSAPPLTPWSGLGYLLGLNLAILVGFSWLPLSYYRMVGWPWIGLWQLGWLALLGWLMVKLRQWPVPLYRLGHGLDGWLAAAGLGLVLSSGFSPFPRVAGWNASLAVSYGLGLYAYRNWVDRSPLTRSRLWLGWVAVAAGVAVVSLALWRPAPDLEQGQDFWRAIRNYQPLGHHNFVGGYLVLTLPLGVAAAIAYRGWIRSLASLATVLMALALYISGSRGAALGGVLWLLVTWLTRLARARGRQRWRWAGLGLVGLGLVALGLATNPRIRAWFAPGGGFQADGPTLDRWFMLRLGRNILGDRPLVGVGPGVMSRVSNLYRPIEAGTGLDHIQQLHNTPLQLAGELGLPGLLLYLVGLALVGRLWWRLWQQPLSHRDRALLGGIGGGLGAYGVSSLTDYQLENIPIAATLLILVVLLISLGDAYGLGRIELSPARRRGASLALWIWVGLLFYLWLPFTLTVGFGAWADGAFYRQELNRADRHWHRATLLSPWDPTAAAVASEALYGLDQVLGDSEAKDNLRSLLLDYAHRAQRAAPNDVWFNQNLAVLHQQDDPALALTYAARAVQLLPRHRNYGYWLLGVLLEAQGQRQLAIAALTLEALVNPAALTYPPWQSEPLQALYGPVVQQTLAEYDRLLTQLHPTDPGFNALYETRVVLGWWTDQPLAGVDSNRLRPIVQAVLRADSDRPAALEQVEATLASQPTALDLRLLAAWLDPAQHWATYAEAVSDSPDWPLRDLEASLTRQPLKTWLTALRASPSQPYRGALTFAYRNYQAKQISLILYPQHLQTYALVSKLNLFQPWPREFPALDHRLETLRGQALGLPHPTRNLFRLSRLSPEPLP
ncbi:MAG TPA: O-antigen ligase family protein [Leptolyngbyaceae cyanobacterium M65_K2018_010]|nr:O-antigen ligase family protein [Leptolyngbyaceae cyanobacterium M65_K2018_010]